MMKKLVDRKLGYQRLSNLLFSIDQSVIINCFDTSSLGCYWILHSAEIDFPVV